jgi:hypothetical protein
MVYPTAVTETANDMLGTGLHGLLVPGGYIDKIYIQEKDMIFGTMGPVIHRSV